jgi:hypothetical protein
VVKGSGTLGVGASGFGIAEPGSPCNALPPALEGSPHERHPDVVLGVSRHKDPGALTVLVQDEVGGLEVRRKDGEWVGVQPRRDAFVINVGDAFQVVAQESSSS